MSVIEKHLFTCRYSTSSRRTVPGWVSVIEKHLFACRLERVVFPYHRLYEAVDITAKAGGDFVLKYHGEPDLYRYDRKTATESDNVG